MIKKTLILGLVIFGLLSFSTLSVTAVEDELGDESKAFIEHLKKETTIFRLFYVMIFIGR